MRIPQKFPQYVGERALFIVTGSEDAKLYLAGDGEIAKVAAFRVKPPVFDTKEKSLYPLAQGKQTHQKEFVATLVTQVKKTVGTKKLHHAYLFTPSPTKNIVTEALPSPIKNVLRKTVLGNYLDKTTVELFGILHK